MTEYTVLLPEYHPKQAAFVYATKKRIVVKAGRRGGKTVGVGGRAVERFLNGARVLYATPTAEQIGRFWSTVTTALAAPIRDGLYAKNETEHTIELVGTEQRIKAKTAWNADTLRGDYGDELIFDEFQLMNEDAWEVVGAPMMLDTNGTAIFVYTPPSIRSAGVSKANDKRYASKLFKRAQADTTGRWATFHFASHDNPYLSSVALQEIAQDMTSLAYRQEILAEDIDEIPGALWKRAELDAHRVIDARVFSRIVIGVDPKASAEADSETGIIVMGLGQDGRGYVIADYSIDGTPEQWAQRVAYAYETHSADRVIVEVNQGGDMVSSVLRATGVRLPIQTVRASRGKYTRAEPIAALYEQGKVVHVGVHSALEDQLCTWTPGDSSPDRLDALCWAAWALMLDGQSQRPRVREY